MGRKDRHRSGGSGCMRAMMMEVVIGRRKPSSWVA